MHLEEATGIISKKSQDMNTIKDLLHDAGFEAVVEHTYMLPSIPWPRDKKQKAPGTQALPEHLAGPHRLLHGALIVPDLLAVGESRGAVSTG